MKVFNPGRTPVTVDRGRVVAAGEWADVPQGKRLRRAVDAGRLLARDETPDGVQSAAGGAPAPPSTPPPASGATKKGAAR